MSRFKERPEFKEENERILKIWRQRGMKDEDLDGIVREFGSSEFVAYWDEPIEPEAE